MAMSLSLSPPSDVHSVDSNDIPTTNMIDQIPPSSGPKRKPSRRANTAERRATHNAVERQRRETLNGRFLDLAALLPNLSQIRRPSKSSIVNSSIAHIQASRRHRLIAARELKSLKNEADALRREVNEWRDRAGLPRVEEPVRGEAFAMVITAELEVIQGVPIEEEDEDPEDGFGLGLMGPIPGIPQQQIQVYNPPYIDEVDEEAAILGAMYAQQQQQNANIHMAQHHQIPQQPMIPQQPHELEDPRMAAMLKNSNSYVHNAPQTVPSNGYHPPTYPNWVPSQVSPFAPGHIFSPPSTSHGLANNNNNNNNSPTGSPVGGASANTGSPASTTSSLSSLSASGSGGSPLSVVVPPLGIHRERSGSLSPGSQSPHYDLHPAALQDFTTGGGSGVPRLGMGQGGGAPSFVPSHSHHHHHVHHGHGGHALQVQPQAISVGGGANAVMMMMM